MVVSRCFALCNSLCIRHGGRLTCCSVFARCLFPCIVNECIHLNRCVVVQVHAASLRLIEMELLQESAESRACELLSLRDERERITGSVQITGSNTKKQTSHRTIMRELIAKWVAWHLFMQPPGVLPPEAVEAEWFAGIFPWNAGGLGKKEREANSKQSLELALFKAEQELQRSQEELMLLPVDACALLNNNKYQRVVIVQHIASNADRLSVGLLFFFTSKLYALQTLYSKAKKSLKAAGMIPLR
jgi:hypothetical protein